MIEPEEEDIGRRVMWFPYNGDEEEGRITAFDDENVFVQLDGNTTPTPLWRQDLYWSFPKPTDKDL